MLRSYDSEPARARVIAWPCLRAGDSVSKKSPSAMDSSGGVRRRERCKKSRSAAAGRTMFRKNWHPDAAKAAVLAHLGQLVRDGNARWSPAGNGVVELVLSSGEVFHLGTASVTRIA